MTSGPWESDSVRNLGPLMVPLIKVLAVPGSTIAVEWYKRLKVLREPEVPGPGPHWGRVHRGGGLRS